MVFSIPKSRLSPSSIVLILDHYQRPKTDKVKGKGVSEARKLPCKNTGMNYSRVLQLPSYGL